ncbi:MAG: DUF6049 family protein [Actinomycetes bacterium]
MRKLLSLFFVALFILAPLAPASAEPIIVRIVSPAHQTFTGEFRNDDLSQELTPSGKLGQLVYVPVTKSKIWVIDPALIDEVTAMTGDYKLATGATSIGSMIATNWLAQLQKVSKDNEIVALAYGNPDIALAKSLAPSELRMYYAFGKSQLQLALMRIVRSEPSGGWSMGKSNLSAVLRKNYSDNRKSLTRLSRVVDSYDLMIMRAQLSRLLSPTLDKDSREYFSYSAKAAVDKELHKLRINPGKYQVTTESAKLPVTIINEFPVEVQVDVAMIPMNSRVVAESFVGIKIPANSKKQLELKLKVIAPGETTIFAQITDSNGLDVVPQSILQINSTVIDKRVTWFTTGSAILLLLAAVAQSVRRVRKGRKIEI